MLEQPKDSGGFEWQQPVGVSELGQPFRLFTWNKRPNSGSILPAAKPLHRCLSGRRRDFLGYRTADQSRDGSGVLSLHRESPLACNRLVGIPLCGQAISLRFADFPDCSICTDGPYYLIATVVVWLVAPPSPQTLSHLITTGWKFPVLITFVFGILSFLYHSTKERLERRNVELQQTVDGALSDSKCKSRSWNVPEKYSSLCFQKKFLSFRDLRSQEHGSPLALSAEITTTCSGSAIIDWASASRTWLEKVYQPRC